MGQFVAYVWHTHHRIHKNQSYSMILDAGDYVDRFYVTFKKENKALYLEEELLDKAAVNYLHKIRDKNMNEIFLGVNVDHIATLRQARGTNYPDPVYAASVAEHAGAAGITVHLREDRRHIQDRDVEILAQTVQTRLNLEMAVTDEMLAIAEEVKPVFCCLVPEKREELTTEGGLDVKGQLSRIKESCQQLSEAGIRVSLFIDADERITNSLKTEIISTIQ